jgi:hypothetical protein
LMDIDENDSNRKFSYLQMLLKRYYMNNNIWLQYSGSGRYW